MSVYTYKMPIAPRFFKAALFVDDECYNKKDMKSHMYICMVNCMLQGNNISKNSNILLLQ